MEKRLEKTLKEEAKLTEQIRAMKEKLNDVREKREEYEKSQLYKLYKKTNITLEEYTMIVTNATDEYLGYNDEKEQDVNETL